MGQLTYKHLTRLLITLMTSGLLACGGGGSGGGGTGGGTASVASSVTINPPTPTSAVSTTSVPSEDPSSTPSSSATSSSATSSSASSVELTTTLTLGTPTTNPILIPPSGTPTRVKFLSVVRGTYYPEKLLLDETDKDGKVTQSAIATLKDDGLPPDLYRGDQIYSGELLLSSIAPTEKSYLVHADHKGAAVNSGVGRFWVSGCPANARQSNPDKAVLDIESESFVFANEVLITLKNTVPQELDVINEILQGVNGKVVGCIPALRQYLVELDDSSSVETLYAAINNLKGKPEQVAEVTPNALVLSPEKENATACDGQCQWYMERIRAPEAWALVGGGDEQMGVGLIDFGVDCLLSDVKCTKGNSDLNYGNGAEGKDHGTGVASLIGAQKELPNADVAKANQMVGVAWNTALHPYSLQKEGGSQYMMSQLITTSMSDATIRVINISAATSIDPGNKLHDAMCSAIASGRLIVAAAGNASTAKNCQLERIYPARYNNTLEKCANGADLAKGLLVVGAIDNDNNLAEWDAAPMNADSAEKPAKLCSNTLYVDMFAPGKNIFTASTVEVGGYGTKNGTSFSAPLAAGAAAVLWAAKPTLTVSEIHDKLMATSATYAKTAKQARSKTLDPRMEGKRLLDLFAAVGGKDAVIPPKLIPDPFAFGSLTNAEHNAIITSPPVTIKGIEAAVPVNIKGGFYSIDNAPFTSAAGTIEPNQTLKVQVLSADIPLASREVTLSVGGVSQTFQVATAAVVTAQPTSFNFNDVVNAALSNPIVSGSLGIAGIAAGTPISIENGEYSIAGGPFTRANGTVNANQAIQLRVTAASEPETKVTAKVTIGGFSDTFSATTVVADILPDAFSFTDAYNAAPATVVTSNVITVKGINTAVSISVSGGEYSIDGGEYRTTASTVRDGQVVQVRHKSASGFSSDSYTTVTIGNYSTNFRSRTPINPEDVQKFLLIMPAILHLTLYP